MNTIDFLPPSVSQVIRNAVNERLKSSLENQTNRTLRAWKGDLDRYDSWCADNGSIAFPAHPNTILQYVRYLRSRLKAASVARALGTIRKIHLLAMLEDPFEDPIIERLISEYSDAARLLPKDTPTIEKLKTFTEAAKDTAIGYWAKAIVWVTYDTGLHTAPLTLLSISDFWKQPNGIAYVNLTDKITTQFDVNYYISRSTVFHLENWTSRFCCTDGPVFPRVTPRGLIRSEHASPTAIRLTLNDGLREARLPRDFLTFRSIGRLSAKDSMERGADFDEVLDARRLNGVSAEKSRLLDYHAQRHAWFKRNAQRS